MDRPTPGHGQVRAEPPAPPGGPAPEAPPPPPRARISTGWRIALFVWVTAFGFLAVYELLSALFKLLKLR